MHPHAFRCDQGAEFLNDKLVLWLREQGIELQTTAPYSPSQNGAAERLNRTLVELARAMMIGANVPMFLWEYALQHAAYLRERAPTKAYANSAVPFMSSYKARKNSRSCYRNLNNKFSSARGTTNSSRISPDNRGRPNP